MLFKTYQKITTLFKEHHGYMSFADLRDHQVTVLQLAEMEEEGSLERFARGWYWCKDCGYEKPEDYQYIEIAKVNPRAVICMDSAAWLAGMLKEEPATIAVATARTDRKKWIWKILKSDVFISRMPMSRAKSVRKRQSLVPTNIILRREPFVTVCA